MSNHKEVTTPLLHREGQGGGSALNFECDYNNGAHPAVLRALVETNDQTSLTYGFDEWSDRAKDRIRAACQCPDADVFFLVGGTQTNATVIDGMLRSYEGVVCVGTAHINAHESGAVEASGHKVITLPSHLGKMHADDLRHFMEVFTHDESRDHVAQPGMVYITMPTELGTIYQKSEIEAIRRVCTDYDLPLYIDGARLGYGLMADECDFDLAWLCSQCDAIYIGGTKVGTLCGEAVVFTHGNAPKCFFTIVKRHGALLAKGRLAGVQFDALFRPTPQPLPCRDGRGHSEQQLSHNETVSTPLSTREGQGVGLLYFHIARHAIEMAHRLRDILAEAGFRFFIDSPTNQQFVIMPNDRMHRLESHVLFTHWEPYDADHTVCRFVTSWATTEEDLLQLISLLRQY
ncbi:MAG: amino acid lyase [Bacteroidaceae bacterium]|nr:amino acid lyase [Bacteroidaceae bacterium]